MAEIFPTEGLDYLLGVLPKGAAAPSSLYLFLFTGATASTVPGADAVLSAPVGFAEAAFSGYDRVEVAAADWGATPTTETVWGVVDARVVTAAQKSFPAATAADSTPINGFGLATTPDPGTGVALYFSNFDDQTAISSLALGDIIRVTPKYGHGG